VSPPEGQEGEFAALELESGAVGLCFLLLDDTLTSIAALAQAVQGVDAREMVAWWAHGQAAAASPARAALGYAAVNALTRAVFDRAGFVPPRAGNSIGGLDPQPGDAIGMVGLFPPLVRRVVAAGARLTVLELRPELAGEHEGYTVTLDPQALAACTQVLSTSTVLLNHSFDGVRQAARAAQRFVLVGPGAGCPPDPLFAAGVSAMAGSWIADPAALVRAITTGASWGDAVFKFLLERERYPGWAAMLRSPR
jgi:uncharacterized protein (DUF4213/DUF364 family)